MPTTSTPNSKSSWAAMVSSDMQTVYFDEREIDPADIMNAALAYYERGVREGEIPAGDLNLAAALLDTIARANALLDGVKAAQYERCTNAGVTGEIEECGVKVRIVAPTTARTVDGKLVKTLQAREDYQAWAKMSGAPTDFHRDTSRSGYISLKLAGV